MAIDIRRRMSGERRRGDLRGLVRSRAVTRGESVTGRIVHAVTIKGIDKSDGATVWEYGPGSFWRQHYEADAITGIVPNLAATLDKYAIAAVGYPLFVPCGDRNAGTLAANAAEAMSLVKLNSLDGTTIEESVIPGFFCSEILESSVVLIRGVTVANSAALSGGDFVIVGERLPIIEFVDFESNGATKDYILHPHGQQAGNVYLRTRTSSETITIPYDSTASEVEALFEATADCVAATATGGPWPLEPISIEVEWSVSGGDISAISATADYAIEGAGIDVEVTNVFQSGDGTYWFTMTVNSVPIGSIWKLQFDGSGPNAPSPIFEYEATTDNLNDFVSDLRTEFDAFRALNLGEENFDTIVFIQAIDNVLTVEYGPDAINLILVVEGGAANEDTRRAGSCAAVYDTGTGQLTSAVGYEFGYSVERPALRMFSDSEENPAVTGLSVLGIKSIGSGPSNTVVIVPLERGTGEITKANVIERWSISGGAWSFDWQTFGNSQIIVPQIIAVESGYLICPIANTDFGSGYTSAGIIDVADGTATPYSSSQVSTSSLNFDNHSSALLYDSSNTDVVTFGFDVTFEQLNTSFRFNAFGIDTDCNGTALLLGGIPFGCDATRVYANAGGTGTVRTRRPNGFTVSGLAAQWRWRFYLTVGVRHGGTTQFRFVFTPAVGTDVPIVRTEWLDWDATPSEIAAAIIAEFGENTAGGDSNVTVWPFGEPMFSENAYISQVEKNLDLLLLTANDSGGLGSNFIPSAYIGLGAFPTIELQNVQSFTSPAGIAAFDSTDASLIWSRPFGSRSGVAQASQYAWLQGDLIYAYGTIVDSEL